MEDSEWLGEVAQRKVREVMVGLSERVRDPFRPVEERLRACLDLFRFDRTGRGLVEWAVAQSGLDDPLSRFTRHELDPTPFPPFLNLLHLFYIFFKSQPSPHGHPAPPVET